MKKGQSVYEEIKLNKWSRKPALNSVEGGGWRVGAHTTLHPSGGLKERKLKENIDTTSNTNQISLYVQLNRN